MTDETQPPSDGMLAHILKELVELQTSVAVLKARVEAQERLLLATALTLPLTRRVPYLEMATALQLNAQAVGEANSARLMTAEIERWKKLCGADLQVGHAQLLQGLLSDTLLLAGVPEHLKSAQTAWLSIATPEEIAQELVDKLPARRAAGAKPAQPARGAVQRKKKPGGGGD